MEDDRPSVAHVDQEEAEEDALPDWTQFAKFAKTNGDKGLTGTTAVPFIPKRGEKDFEPLAASSAFPPSSNEATLSLHQQHMLQTSRNALYTALSSGSRQHSSRQHNSFTWRPELARATCDNGIATYGVHFGAIGHFHVERKRVELLPEEALYMNERGAIELWTETPEGARVPMSVQQAWAELIGHDELTPERYQVYAFLKRLGYTLVRARPIPGVEKPPPDRPFSLYYAVRDCLANYYSDLRRTVLRLLHSLHSIVTNVLAHRVRLVTTRAVGGREGRYASLVSGRRWANYDQLFSRLQIIPTGHDAPLARAPLAQTPSVLIPLVPSPTPSHTLSAPTTSVGGTRAKPLQDLEEFPYQPFYHMYKPISKYKKSSPPPPDFRIVIVNGSTTPMPTLFEFSDMFSSVPFPNEDTLLPPPPVQRAPGSGGPSAAKPVVARNNNNNNNKPKPPPVMSATSAAAAINVSSPRSPPPRPSLFETFVAKVAFVSTWFSQGVRQGGGGSGGANRSNNNNGNGNGGRPNKKSGGPPHSSGGGGKKKGGGGRPSPYPRLKTGRRSILVCVVTDGTSSILRFSETEFAKLPWKGQARSA